MGRHALHRAAAARASHAARSRRWLGGCGDTLQVQPVPHNQLEGMIVAPFRVYWLGGAFRGLAVQQVSHDPGGAYSVQYGNCLTGGQGTCVPPLLVVTSPDNSFVPGGSARTRQARIRGRPGARGAVRTGGDDPHRQRGGRHLRRHPQLARAAARNVVPINAPGAPRRSAPAARPTSAFSGRRCSSQVPSPLRPLHRCAAERLAQRSELEAPPDSGLRRRAPGAPRSSSA